MLTIVKITELPSEYDSLLQESIAENFNFLLRAKNEFLSLENTFNERGEGNLVAIGGINRQSTDSARLRRFYVSASFRRKGFGSMLLMHIENEAQKCFQSIVLNTDTDRASIFYEKHNYKRVSESGISHIKHINGEQNVTDKQ